MDVITRGFRRFCVNKSEREREREGQRQPSMVGEKHRRHGAMRVIRIIGRYFDIGESSSGTCFLKKSRRAEEGEGRKDREEDLNDGLLINCHSTPPVFIF